MRALVAVLTVATLAVAAHACCQTVPGFGGEACHDVPYCHYSNNCNWASCACVDCFPASTGSEVGCPYWTTYLDAFENYIHATCNKYDPIPPQQGRRLKAKVPDAGIPLGLQACEDIATIVNAPLGELAARLSYKFCKNGTVGVAFAQAVLDVLDADLDGDIDCNEWAIASKKGSIATFSTGGYFGRKNLPLPECIMSETGKNEWIAANEHIAELRAATLAAAKTNATLAAAMASAVAQDVKNVPLDTAGFVKDKAAALANVTIAKLNG